MNTPTKNTISPIINISELFQIRDKDELLIIDATNVKDAKLNYEKNHLDKALFIDINSQLAEIQSDVSNGGRHPLPSITNFLRTLKSLGIGSNNHVVIYDENNGSNAASRLWWMLKAIGHEKVQVLNGGFAIAKKMNYPINSKKVIIQESINEYQISEWLLPLVTIDQVEQFSNQPSHLIIDVRDENRYLGKVEPIDLIAGHIPNAINIPFSENINSDGLFLHKEELKKKYKPIFDKYFTQNIIVHCGSGVTACHTLLALDFAGFEIPNLYVGSWSEWSRKKL